MTAAALEEGYWRAYRDFYRWGSILRGAAAKPGWTGRLRHFAYAAGWKKCEPLWDWIIRLRRVPRMLPLLESVLAGFGEGEGRAGDRDRRAAPDASGRKADPSHLYPPERQRYAELSRPTR